MEAGSLKLKLFKDTTFVVTALNIVLWTKEDKKVIVGDWTTSKLGLLTHAPWYMTANKRYRNGELLFSFRLTEVEKTDKYEYSLDGKFAVYRSGVMIGSSDWIFSLNEDSLILAPNTQGSSTYGVRFSDNEMIISVIQPYADGLPCLAEVTYERK